MRLIILCLILANLGFFYWQTTWSPAPMVKNPVLDLPIPAGVQRLALLDEDAPVHIASETTAEEEIPATTTNNTVSGNDMMLALVGEDANEIIDDVPANETDNDTIEAETETTAEIPVEIATATAPTDETVEFAEVAQPANNSPLAQQAAALQQRLANATKVSKFLQQLSEEQTALAPAVTTPTNTATTEPTAVKADKADKDTLKTAQAVKTTPLLVTEKPQILCYKTGLYANKNTAMQSEKWLQRQGIETQLITRINAKKADKAHTTRVYLPPFPNQAAARAMQQRLQQQGIRDHIIIQTGALRHAISLGVYRNGDSVKNRLTQLRAKGYFNVQVEIIGQAPQQRYQLQLRLNADKRPLLKQFSEKFRLTTPVTMACAHD